MAGLAWVGGVALLNSVKVPLLRSLRRSSVFEGFVKQLKTLLRGRSRGTFFMVRRVGRVALVGDFADRGDEVTSG